jgi:PTS system sucrose-specific IIC component
MSKNTFDVENIVTLLGGKDNIKSVSSCMTRCRVDVKNVESVNQKELSKITNAISLVIVESQVQIVLGPGKCTRLAESLADYLGVTLSIVQDDDLKESISMRNQTPFKLLLKKISSVFIPILPAIIACGLIMGFNNVALKALPGYSGTPVSGVISSMANAAFSYLPIFVGISAAKVFGGSPFLGGTIAALLQIGSLANITLFGITMSPGRGGIIAVLIAVAFSTYIEKKLRKIIPDSISIFAVPLLTLFIAGFIALLVIQPIGGMISDLLKSAVMLAVNQGSIVSGFLMAAGWLPLVMTGLHQSIIPIHAELIQQFGYTPLLAIFGMVGAGQIGAVLYVLRTTKSARLKKVILSGIPVQIMGIGEPLIYGCTLPLVKPFITACLSAGVGGALAAFFHINSMGMGLSGIPLAMMLDQPLLYIAIWSLVIVISYFLTMAVGYDDFIDE